MAAEAKRFWQRAREDPKPTKPIIHTKMTLARSSDHRQGRSGRSAHELPDPEWLGLLLPPFRLCHP